MLPSLSLQIITAYGEGYLIILVSNNGMCKSYHVRPQFTKYFHRNFKVDSH